LKGALYNGAVLSAIPISAFSHGVGQEKNLKEDIPRLPLKIHLSSGLTESFQKKLEGLSPQLTITPRLEGSALDQEIAQFDIWFGRISKDQFAKTKNLRWVQSSSAGVESYVFPELVESDVLLSNAKGCYAPAIGDHAMGLLFSMTRAMVSQTRNMAQGKWSREENMVEMKGMTMGIVGLGGIGSQVARRARAMDMKIIAVDLVPKYKEQIGDICEEVRLIQDNNLPWLLENADVVVCAAPHTKISEGMFGREQFEMMKEGVYFINVSRGKLVQTTELVKALESGKVAGAGLDVTNPEPLPSDHPLWKLPNVIITSHIAARSQHSSDRMQAVFVENVHRFIHGLPLLNQVDKVAGF